MLMPVMNFYSNVYSHFSVVLRQSLEQDQMSLQRMKKIVKAIHNSGLSECSLIFLAFLLFVCLIVLSSTVILYPFDSKAIVHNNMLRPSFCQLN